MVHIHYEMNNEDGDLTIIDVNNESAEDAVTVMKITIKGMLEEAHAKEDS